MPGAPSSVLQGNPQNFQNWHQQYLGSGQQNIFLEGAVAISDGLSTWQTLPEAPSCVLQENFQNFQNQNKQHLGSGQQNIFLDDAGAITDEQPTWQTLSVAPSGVLQEHFQNFQNQKQQHLVSEQQNIFLEDAGAINGGQLTWQTLYGAPSSGLQENFQNFQNQNQQYLVSGQIDMDGLVGDGSLGVSVESLSSDDADPSDRVLEGFTLEEIQLIVEFEKMDCCHFSPDGKLLAMGGHNKLVSLYSTSSNWPVPFEFSLLVGVHYEWITDVRFSPSMPRIIATSSADKNVNVWDVDSPHVPRYSFTDHSETVLTLDFHPGKEDLLFSSDYRVIRCWNISDADGECTLSSRPSKFVINQIRFEPSTGKYLAVAANNFIIILDGETLVDKDYFKGHIKDIHSVCWHSSGEFLASVSDDLVRVWRVNEGKCVYKLETNGKKFNTCVFHPSHDCLLIIGCHKTFEIWNFLQNKLISMPAHGDLVSCLAVSNVAGFVASASHDKHVKLWK